MRGYAALLGAALCAVACAKDAPRTGGAAGAATNSPIGVVRVRGAVLVRDDTTMVFAACGSTAEQALHAPPSSQLPLAIVAVNGALRDSVYAELSVDTTGGRLLARDTHFASPFTETPPCDRPRMAFDWDATGNEPFWHLTVDGTQVVFERPEPPRELVFDAEPPQTSGALTTIIAHRALGRVHDLKLGLLREPCRDGMSDSWYPYRAELRVGDLALHGCARR